MSFDAWLDKVWLVRFVVDRLPSSLQDLRRDHPLRIALRTYTLALSLSLGPALISFVTARTHGKNRHAQIAHAIRKELGPQGFAFAMTVAVAGGQILDRIWQWTSRQEDRHRYVFSTDDELDKCLQKLNSCTMRCTPAQRTFYSNVISSCLAIASLHAGKHTEQTNTASVPLTVPTSPLRNSRGGKTSPSLNLTLMLFVRALDVLVRGFCVSRASKIANAKGKQREGDIASESARTMHKLSDIMSKLDAFVFWVASSRIMWCFFYEPERLPRSYVKWIGALANVDARLIDVLRMRRRGTWTYGEIPTSTFLTQMAHELGYPSAWADAALLPAYGGPQANRVWSRLGVKGRDNVGGLPCEIVHGDVGGLFGSVGRSCLANVAIRGTMGFLEALAIYAPVHFLPTLLSQPRTLLSPSRLRKNIAALFRSSLFLSMFISSIWSAICMTRTLVVARLLPNISHNFYDGPFGCILAGCIACGSSIWIEQGGRRGEMALYVLPRAIRSMLEDSWLRNGTLSLRVIERSTFVFSLATVLTASRHSPETLRGLSRWTMLFIMKGPNAPLPTRSETLKLE